MSEVKCKRCGHVLTNQNSIEQGYGDTCYRIKKLHEKSQTTSPNTDIIEEILDRVRRLELDRTYILCQLKHKTFGKRENAWDDFNKPEEHRPEREPFKAQFNVLIVKELKMIFEKEENKRGENFNYHEILKPVEPRTDIENSPILEEIKISN